MANLNRGLIASCQASPYTDSTLCIILQEPVFWAVQKEYGQIMQVI